MILQLLERMVAWMYRKQRAKIEVARQEALATFIHETLPAKVDSFVGRLVVSNGTFNYFVLPTGELPHFDYAFLELPMYVVLLTPENSEWEVAQKYGISRLVWEAARKKRAAVKEGVMDMPMAERPIQPLFWELAWDLPLSQEALLDDFRTNVRFK